MNVGIKAMVESSKESGTARASPRAVDRPQQIHSSSAVGVPFLHQISDGMIVTGEGYSGCKQWVFEGYRILGIVGILVRKVPYLQRQAERILLIRNLPDIRYM